MTEKELEKEAREKAEEIEKRLTLGVYSNDEDLARDESYNDGYVMGYEYGYIAGAEPREKRIAELEKENRDLKTDLELERKNKTNVFAELNDETARSNSMLMEELAEAGEIIQLFLDANNELDMINAQRRAEDFIKE